MSGKTWLWSQLGDLLFPMTPTSIDGMTIGATTPEPGTFTTATATTATIGTGGIVDQTSGIRGVVNTAQRLSLPVTAVASTAFTMSLPAGAMVIQAQVYTTTAYTGATVTIQIGATASASDYVSAVTIKTAGLHPLTLIEPGGSSIPLSSLPAPPNLFITITQTATYTNVGAAVLMVEYVLT